MSAMFGKPGSSVTSRREDICMEMLPVAAADLQKGDAGRQSERHVAPSKVLHSTSLFSCSHKFLSIRHISMKTHAKPDTIMSACWPVRWMTTNSRFSSSPRYTVMF